MSNKYCFFLNKDYLNVPHEPVIAVEVHGAKLAHAVELESDGGRVGARVVAPPDPGGALGCFSYLVAAKLSIHQLAETPAQLGAPLPVVYRVGQLGAAAALVALRHRVRRDAHCDIVRIEVKIE